MGRRKKSEVEPAIKPAKSNGSEPAKVQSYVDRVESLHADIASIMGKAMNECRAVHGDIKLVYDEAKDTDHIPKKALKKVIKARALERKADECREELEGDDQDSYDMIRHALGDLADTPLGEAATREFAPPSTAEQPFAAS